MYNNIKKLYCRKSISIKGVLQLFNTAKDYNLPTGIVLFVDNKESLIGVISEGDIRRAILSGAKLEDKAFNYIKKDPIVFSIEEEISSIIKKLPNELKKRKRESQKYLSKIILVNKDNSPSRVIGYHEIWEQKVATHREISIIGMGYVGLTLALVLADSGFNVNGVESNKKILDNLKQGESHIFENGLTELIEKNKNKTLFFSNQLKESDVFIITVGTPVKIDINGKKTPDLFYLNEACKNVGKKLTTGNLVILRSTVPVGTSRSFVKKILEKESKLKCGIDFSLSFAPERTAEGSAIKELRSLPQIIGGFDKDSFNTTAAIFRDITSTIVEVNSIEEAEMIKLINNSFRDYVFAFSNQIAKIASHYNINSYDLIQASNRGYIRDPVPFPSPGVGGPCLTKDPYIFSSSIENLNEKNDIFSNGRCINESMHDFVYRRIINTIKAINKNDPKILICGLAFKGYPETGDLRNSSSISIAKNFINNNFDIYGYDAVAPKDEIEKFNLLYHDISKGFKEFDVVLFLNNHISFKKIDIFQMIRSMKEKPIVFDGWSLFNGKEIISIRPSIYLGLSHTQSSIKEYIV